MDIGDMETRDPLEQCHRGQMTTVTAVITEGEAALSSCPASALCLGSGLSSLWGAQQWLP